jgi:uncharacterized membrane protein
MAIQKTGTTAQNVATGLGWFSIGLGAAEMMFPTEMARLIGAPTTSRVRAMLRGFGAREVAAGLAILARPHDPRPIWGRVAGDALDLFALRSVTSPNSGASSRRALAGASVAAVTIVDAMCAMQLGREASTETGDHAARGFDVRYSVTIRRPIGDVYGFWRNFSNFPRFMRDLESVTVTGDRQSRWRINGPAGVPIEWGAEIVSDQENHMISWRSLPGSSVENRGAVRFEEAPAGRGTEIHVELAYRPPAGQVGRTIAWLFGKDPRQQVREDLRRVKQILELGEVPLSEGPGLLTSARPPTSAAAARVLVGVEP